MKTHEEVRVLCCGVCGFGCSGPAEHRDHMASSGHTAPPTAHWISVGDVVIWEPDSPHARCRVVLVEIVENEDREVWVRTWGSPFGPSPGTHLNELSRYTEAVGASTLPRTT